MLTYLRYFVKIEVQIPDIEGGGYLGPEDKIRDKHHGMVGFT